MMHATPLVALSESANKKQRDERDSRRVCTTWQMQRALQRFGVLPFLQFSEQLRLPQVCKEFADLGLQVRHLTVTPTIAKQSHQWMPKLRRSAIKSCRMTQANSTEDVVQLIDACPALRRLYLHLDLRSPSRKQRDQDRIVDVDGVLSKICQHPCISDIDVRLFVGQHQHQHRQSRDQWARTILTALSSRSTAGTGAKLRRLNLQGAFSVNTDFVGELLRLPSARSLIVLQLAVLDATFEMWKLLDERTLPSLDMLDLQLHGAPGEVFPEQVAEWLPARLQHLCIRLPGATHLPWSAAGFRRMSRFTRLVTLDVGCDPIRSEQHPWRDLQLEDWVDVLGVYTALQRLAIPKPRTLPSPTVLYETLSRSCPQLRSVGFFTSGADVPLVLRGDDAAATRNLLLSCPTAKARRQETQVCTGEGSCDCTCEEAENENNTTQHPSQLLFSFRRRRHSGNARSSGHKTEWQHQIDTGQRPQNVTRNLARHCVVGSPLLAGSAGRGRP